MHPVHRSKLIRKVLAKIPPEVADTFSEEQLIALNRVLGGRSWARHKINLYKSFSILGKNIYLSFQYGIIENRQSEIQKHYFAPLFLVLFIAILVIIFLLCLYLIRSYLGINLFDNYSLGLWKYFKELFLSD